MEKIQLSLEIEKYNLEELCDKDKELVMKAVEATNGSYAPYSNFNVGAAVRLSNDAIVCGANQENAAYPSGICAERTAVFAAQANFPRESIKSLAIAAKNVNGITPQPITPCGSCRQVLIEIEDRYKIPMRVILYGKQAIYIIKSAKELLPLSFLNENMQ